MNLLYNRADSNDFSDVKIRVYNNTNNFENIIIFVQEDELNLMFNKLFPVAWQVFPLPGKEEGVERWGTTIYPSNQQIGVTRNLESTAIVTNEVVFEITQRALKNLKSQGLPDSLIQKIQNLKNQKIIGQQTFLNQIKPMLANEEKASELEKIILNTASGYLNIRRDASNGEKFEYRVDNQGGQNINKLSQRNNDGIISCQNNTDSLVSIDFYKNDSKIVTWPKVANGDEAKFKLTRKIFFMYDSSLEQGRIITSKINNDQVASVDLTGYSTVEARLTYDPNVGGQKKIWNITAR